MRLLATVLTLLLPSVPGTVNPAVTQATIGTTICHPGWTTSIRPTEAWSEALKRRLLTHSGFKDQHLADYELDHLIPLELGGAPADLFNLWLEPRYNGQSQRGDTAENSMRRKVCAGTLALQTARDLIVTWKHVRG